MRTRITPANRRERVSTGSVADSGPSGAQSNSPSCALDRDPGMGVRGQTLQDYVVGIGLFIITMAMVLTALFGFLEPLSTGVDGEDVSETNRVSETVIQNLSSGDSPNELRAADVQSTMDRGISDLRERWGIPGTTRLNVTLTTMNGTRIVERGGTKLAVGQNHGADSVATSARIVTLSDGACQPACRLVVRAW